MLLKIHIVTLIGITICMEVNKSNMTLKEYTVCYAGR